MRTCVYYPIRDRQNNFNEYNKNLCSIADLARILLPEDLISITKILKILHLVIPVCFAESKIEITGPYNEADHTMRLTSSGCYLIEKNSIYIG